MRCLAGASLALAIIAIASPVAAQDFTPAPALGRSYIDLDSADGRFSRWDLGDLCGVNAVEGTLTVPRIGPGRAYFLIAMMTQDRAADIAFMTMDGGASLAGEWGVDGQPDGSTNTSIGLNTETSFSLQWTTSGSVTFRVGDAIRTYELGSTPRVLRLEANSGETMFAVSIGRRGAAPGC